MHSFTLFLFFYLCCQTLSRPQGVLDQDGSEAEEKEYDMESADEDTPEDNSRDREQVANNREETLKIKNLADSGDRAYLEQRSDQSMQGNSDYFSEYKPDKSGRLQEDKEPSGVNDNSQTDLKHTHNTYVDNSDSFEQQDSDRNLKYREVKSNKFNEKDYLRSNLNDKQVLRNEEGILFDLKSEVANNKYENNEVQNSNERIYSKSSDNNAADSFDRESGVYENYDNRRFFLNRDTRQTKDTSQKTGLSPQESDSIQEKSVHEDDETAIKRHIRKLSKDELEELKNSLSQDKKILLQSVVDKMNREENNDVVNKREITKKAGAIEDNNLMDPELSNSFQTQGVTSDLEASSESPVALNTRSKEVEQSESQTESNTPATKNAETNDGDTKSEMKSKRNESNLKNKRETNVFDSSDVNEPYKEDGLMDDDNRNWQVSLNEKNCDCNQDSSQFVGEDSQIEYNSRNKKRQISLEEQNNLYDSFKSLEESFPTSDINDNSVAYSGPLIRVKRQDPIQIVKKRSAGVLPDAKVAYFPYKSESDDEDNDEANEFDDEGFYEHTNFAVKNQPLEKRDTDSKLVPNNSKFNNIEEKKSNEELEVTSVIHSGVNDLSEEKSNLGSDTDSVLSGVEGVDDNLMFNSNLRDRRTVNDFTSPTTDQINSVNENSLNPINYRENDAFGPLPRNYEGELGRYKRIRRLKQSQQSLDGSSV